MPRPLIDIDPLRTVEATLEAMEAGNGDVLADAFTVKFGSSDELRKAGRLHLARTNDGGTGAVVLRLGPAPSA
jgi:hypothetical protein